METKWIYQYGTWHELKVWPQYFNALINDIKKFEVRRNDRDFKQGDYLRLREWNPDTKEYTGAEVTRHVGFILQGGQFGIEEGFCVMGIDKT